MAIYTIKTKDNKDWLRYRWKGLGASEISSLLGYNTYQSRLELWHKKIGTEYGKNIRNIGMLFGQVTEQLSSDLYACYEKNKATTEENYHNNKFIRDVYKYDKYEYVVNDKYPYLFVSPDRLSRPFGSSSPYDTSVEIKDTTTMTLESYKDNVNVNHIIQIKTQMMALEYEKGDLVYLLSDRKDMSVKNFIRDGYIIDNITEEELADRINVFWASVLKARLLNAEIYEAKRNFNMQMVRELAQMLNDIEPEPDTTEAYYNYLSEKGKERLDLTNGQSKKVDDEKHYQIAKELSRLKEEEKELSQKIQHNKNMLLKFMVSHNSRSIEFSKNEKVTLSANNILKVKF